MSVSLAIAMNARGGPGIVLASTAYATGIINESFFVSLVLLSIVTSLVCGWWAGAGCGLARRRRLEAAAAARTASSGGLDTTYAVAGLDPRAAAFATAIICVYVNVRLGPAWSSGMSVFLPPVISVMIACGNWMNIWFAQTAASFHCPATGVQVQSSTSGSG